MRERFPILRKRRRCAVTKKERQIAWEKRELARVLLASGRTYREVAEALDISVGSVHNIMKESGERVGPLVASIKKRFAAKQFILADHILSRITDWDIGKASLKEKVLAAAILADKAAQMEQASEGQQPAAGLAETALLNEQNEQNTPAIPYE